MDDGRLALVAASFDAPCPGLREELLRLAAFREPGAATAATRRHAQKCAACRSFVDTARLGARGAAGAFERLTDLARPKLAPILDLSKAHGFEDWLDGQLADRSEQELALAMSRAARWLLRLDPEIAARLIDPTEEEADGAPRPRPAVDWIDELESRLSLRRALLSGTRGGIGVDARSTRRARGVGRITRAKPERDEALLDLLRRTVAATGHDRPARLRLAHALVDRAQELRKGRLGHGWLVKLGIEWYAGNGGRVPELLDHAEGAAQSANDRASVLHNRALLWCEGERFGRETLDLLGRALVCNPSTALAAGVLTLRATYAGALGQLRVMNRDVESLSRLGLLSRARQRHGVARIGANIRFIANRHGLAAPHTERAIQEVVGAFHGD